MNSGKISIEKQIGYGGTSYVYECSCNKNKYALKIYKKNPKSKIDFINEAKILREIESNNIIKRYKSGIGKFMLNDKNFFAFYILEELMEKGEILNYVTGIDKGFDEYYGRYIFRELIKSVNYLHKKKIAHLDIKADNILLDQNYNIKLCDFGFSKNLKENETNLIEIKVGTLGYQCPEIVANIKNDAFKADIFSLGVSIFAILTGKMPFNSSRKNDLIYQHYKNKNKFIKLITKGLNCELSDEFLDLFYEMVCNCYEKRINIDDILKHPWVNMNCCTQEEFIEECKFREEFINNIDEQIDDFDENIYKSVQICDLDFLMSFKNRDFKSNLIL